MKDRNQFVGNQLQEVKAMYRELIRQVLVENGIKSIERLPEAKSEYFFDNINVNDDGTLTVYKGVTLDNFYFDYSCDYARVLSYIEDEIYVAERKLKTQHGYKVTFNYDITKY